LKSIRQNLTTRLLVGTSLLLVVASVILCVLVRSRLVEEFNKNLETKARTFATLTTREGQRIENEFDGDRMPEFEDEDNPEFFQILFQDGSLINQSESMEEFPVKFPEIGSNTTEYGKVDLEDGDIGRYIQMRILPKSEEVDPEDIDEEPDEGEVFFFIPESANADTATVIIRVAKNGDELAQILGFIYLTVGGLNFLVLAAIVLVVRSSIKTGLKPIEEINAQIAEIEPETLQKRVSIDSPPSELSTIIHALNDLLDRMDYVITRERRFTSDVAHELRTPVSELRTACEVGMMSPEDQEATKLFFEDINDVALQMEKVVSNLLSLSRWDQEKEIITTEEVALDPLLKNCWEHCSKEAQEKAIKLDCEIDAQTSLATDREKFEMIIKNLLENAVAYSIPGSHIRCRLEPGNPSVNLYVENQAANLHKEDLGHLFDRFWRKESARSEVHHSGLGLSIVKALADMLDIKIQTELRDDMWFSVGLNIRIYSGSVLRKRT